MASRRPSRSEKARSVKKKPAEKRRAIARARLNGPSHSHTERSTSSLRMLNEATNILSSSLEYEDVLRGLAKVVVPALADWCVIDMRTDDNSIKRVAVVHEDPQKVRWAHRLQEQYPPKPTDPSFSVLRTGKSLLYPRITDALIKKAVPEEPLRKIVKELGLAAAMTVAIKDRGRVFGIISFMSAESRRRYTKADLELAEKIGRRAGVSVHNALLYREVQEDDRKKDHFLSILAHELRNPLTPLLHSLEFVRLHGIKDPEIKEPIEIATRQARQIGALLKSLLDVTRALHGKIELEVKSISVATLIGHAIETSRPLITNGQQTLTVNLPREELKIEVDPLRIEQILVNLLSNAAKYTPPGGHLTLTVRKDHDTVEFRMKDTGAGISPHIIGRIFDLFVQSDQAPSRMKGGLGIGLRLARMLTELHHGTLIAKSPGVGKGSEFIMRLPLRYKKVVFKRPVS